MELPPEAGARTKLFDREFQFRESHTSAETRKKLLTESLEQNIDFIYMYFLVSRSHDSFLNENRLVLGGSIVVVVYL